MAGRGAREGLPYAPSVKQPIISAICAVARWRPYRQYFDVELLVDEERRCNRERSRHVL